MQDVIGAAIGGREAGVVFEGDRRFPIVIRLNDDVRENVEALKHLPVPLPASAEGGRAGLSATAAYASAMGGHAMRRRA